ncbi:ATP-binding protein [Thiohalomonas denitrificans]|uniref:ATP-binding protein n=1 Tax=Thiohalomonas denitrificans TaxID=415747 RepID=UPI0026EEAB3C|nr:ATP-binding protein [Thiohalomonas denitrificans]
MSSLFTKIFLAFWLAAVLLGITLFALARLFGSEVIEETEQRLAGQAVSAAALWETGGRHAVARWLHNLQPGTQPALVDAEGRPVLRQPLPRHLARWLPRPMESGTHSVSSAHVLVVAALPDTSPPLYLVNEVAAGHLRILPVWTRIPIAILITGLVSLGLAALVTRRLRRLRRAAQALAAGDLNARVGHHGRDEVAALSRDFDQMADRLRDLLNGQQRLLRDVSHELRSPLARLRIALELAERGESRDKALVRIGKEADELERLIADVLSLARLESGQGQLEQRKLSLGDLVRQVATDADFEARAKERTVRFEGGEKLVVFGDAVLLRSAVENVIRNAVRHTAEDSEVTVTLGREDESALVEVRDHGPGVPEEELAKLFRPFARVGEARDRKSGGYGLGLAISRRAVEAHGGGIYAENIEGGGLRVRISLPLTTNH